MGYDLVPLGQGSSQVSKAVLGSLSVSVKSQVMGLGQRPAPRSRGLVGLVSLALTRQYPLVLGLATERPLEFLFLL